MRKRILFFLIAMSVSLAAVSQEDSTTVYRSIFGDSVTTWEGIVNSGGVEIKEQYIESSTIDNIEVGDTIFHRIKLRLYGAYLYYSKENGFVRESENHSQLYFTTGSAISELSYKEILIMDLGLDVGDTLNTNGWREMGSGAFPKITVDSVFYRNGRKCLRTDYTKHIVTDIGQHAGYPKNDTLYFIEGIGPSMDLFYPFVYGYYELTFVTCYKVNDELEYTLWPYYGRECTWGILIDIPTAESDDIKIYPSPAYGIVKISGLEKGGNNYRIASMTGATLLDGFLPDGSGEKEIDISSLPKGQYILSLLNEKTWKKVKIIKL